MGGHTELADLIHLVGTDLDLGWLTIGTNHRRVQRLVEVGFGHGDIVFKPPRHRLPHGVDDSQGLVAVLDRVDDNAKSEQIVNIFILEAAFDHLFIDRIKVFRPAVNHQVIKAVFA